MKVNELKEKLNNGEFNEQIKYIYACGDDKAEYYSGRFTEVIKGFEETFERTPDDMRLFSAPGRTEIGGNHTDHQHGCVLAAGLNLDVIGAVALNGKDEIRIKSKGYPMDVILLDELEPSEEEQDRACALIRGVVSKIVSMGYKVQGFDAYTLSSVLKGSGMSSSAAFEVLVGTIINGLFCNNEIDPIEIAKIAQYAENVYFGKPCGLLDQMACSVGGFVSIDFEDTNKPVINKTDFDFASSGHSLCIVDTKGSHSDLTDDYAAVRSEMEDVASFFGKKVLRECTKADVLKNAGAIKEKFNERAVIRALHYYGENERVVKQADALSKGDFETFKSLIIESGRSSYMYNQNVYTCKKPTNQPLSLALAVSEEILSGKGAWRVHGGGFAGTIQAFVPDSSVEEYTSALKSIFGDDSCYVLSVRPFGGISLA